MQTIQSLWRKVYIELQQKLLTWKSTLEAKGLKVNVSKTKVMFGGKSNKAAVGHVKCVWSLQ